MKIKLKDLEKQKYLLHALGLKEENLLIPITKVKTFLRVTSNNVFTNDLENWMEATLLLNVNKNNEQQIKLIQSISIENFDLVDYSLENYNERNFTFVLENHLMQINYIGFPPQ